MILITISSENTLYNTVLEIYHKESEHKRISNIVSSTIKKSIIKGVFSPEEKIDETSLSELLDISTSSLREALKMLCYESFVLFNKGSGYYVNNITVNDIFHLNEVISIVSKASASTFNPRDMSQVIMLKQSLEKEDTLNNFEQDKRFHCTLALCSKNDAKSLFNFGKRKGKRKAPHDAFLLSPFDKIRIYRK